MPPSLVRQTLALASATFLTIVTAYASGPAAAALAAEEARGAALRSHDSAALAMVLSDELRYIHSTGKIETKADVLQGLREGRVAYERFVTSDVHAAAVADKVVVLSGRIDQRKVTDRRGVDLQLLFHAVYRNEDGVWRQVSLQTALPPLPQP